MNSVNSVKAHAVLTMDPQDDWIIIRVYGLSDRLRKLTFVCADDLYVDIKPLEKVAGRIEIWRYVDHLQRNGHKTSLINFSQALMDMIVQCSPPKRSFEKQLFGAADVVYTALHQTAEKLLSGFTCDEIDALVTLVKHKRKLYDPLRYSRETRETEATNDYKVDNQHQRTLGNRANAKRGWLRAVLRKRCGKGAGI